MKIFANKLHTIDEETLSHITSIETHESGKIYHLHPSFPGDANTIYWSKRHGTFILYCPESTVFIAASQNFSTTYLHIVFVKENDTVQEVTTTVNE